MGEEFFRLSTVTGKTYNYFETIKIYNLQQAMAYVENEVFPVDIKIVRDKENKRCLVWYFNQADTKEIYDKWCNYELN